MKSTKTIAPGESPAHVAAYYDQNTTRFLRFGGSKGVAAIHRQIWTPEVENTEQAFLYLNELVAQNLDPALQAPPAGSGQARLFDLGCGVGGTATWLAQKMDVHITGISISAVQIQIAKERARQAGIEQRCSFVEGDFLDSELLEQLSQPESCRGVYALEAFVHAADPQRFFANAARLLASGGRLVICDDFLAETASSQPQAQKWIRRFQEGWQILSLVSIANATGLAERAGLRLVQDRDLSAYTPLLPHACVGNRQVNHAPATALSLLEQSFRRRGAANLLEKWLDRISLPGLGKNLINQANN